MINLYYLVLVPIAVGLLIYLIKNRYMRYIAFVLQTILLIYTVQIFINVKNTGTIIERLGMLGNNAGITLKADSFTAIMLIVSAFVFLAMTVFNIRKKYTDNLFIFLFLMLEGLLFGIFMSNDLFNIYILIELSAVIVSILIMFKKDSRSIYDGIFYLLVNTIGMVFFLFGIGFIYKIFGTLNIDLIKANMHLIKAPKELFLPYSLMITGVCVKSAIVPVFSWLPKAHATKSSPTIISAVLSGLFIKTGIFLFIKIQDMFGSTIDTSSYFLVLGIATAVTGFILAISQRDLKLILAYHSVSQIGVIMIGLCLEGQGAHAGALYHMINHTFFKSALFLTAGIITDSYGTNDIKKIKGVARKMPVVAIASILAILAITGAPFFNGCMSKYLITSDKTSTATDIFMIIINFGTILSFTKYSSIFFGKPDKTKEKVNVNSTVIILIISLLCLVGGIFGKQIVENLFNYNAIIKPGFYIGKLPVYIINIAIAIPVYHMIKKHKILKKLREMKVNFNDIAILLAFFFISTLIFLYIKG
jgi:multicomponent Na+:H+ antiporter subunit D